MPSYFRQIAGGLALLTLSTAPLFAQSATQSDKIAVTAVVADPISAEIAKNGIAPTLARLRADPSTDPQTRFSRAGLEFLAAVERAYQWRSRYGIGEMGGMLLGSGVELPETAPSAILPPESFAQETEATLKAMDQLRQDTAGLAEGPEFGVALDLGDLWFDLDGNGQRSEFENAASLLDGLAYDSDGPQGEAPIIRFDNADAAWLTAYSHLVSGAGELVLAFDPTPSIQRVLQTRQRIEELRLTMPIEEQFTELYFFDDYFEPLAIAIDMLRHQPDAERTRKAKAHWRETVRLNQVLWGLIAAETDNAGEWLPGDRQISATGLDFPQGTGPAWLAVLADGDALLTGARTIPFWRAPAGIDASAWLENPTPLPLDGILQGWAVMPFFSDAPPVTTESYQRFAQMLFETGPFLAMVMLN